jgi:hypothetical protein
MVSLLKAFGASSRPGRQPLLTPAPQRLCNFWNSTYEPRSYSTQRTGSVLPKQTVTSDSNFHKETREIADDRQCRAEYYRQWLARKLANDPGYRAILSQRRKAWYARKCANEPEWVAERRLKHTKRYNHPDKHEAIKEHNRNYHRSLRDKNPAYKRNDIVRNWVMHCEWVREGLDWTPWQPILYPERVEHQCQKYGATRHGGAKLW